MITFLFIYWIATAIYGTYWLIKHPAGRLYEDEKYFTLLELMGKFFMSCIVAWFIAPMMLLAAIKFKR